MLQGAGPEACAAGGLDGRVDCAVVWMEGGEGRGGEGVAEAVGGCGAAIERGGEEDEVMGVYEGGEGGDEGFDGGGVGDCEGEEVVLGEVGSGLGGGGGANCGEEGGGCGVFGVCVGGGFGSVFGGGCG